MVVYLARKGWGQTRMRETVAQGCVCLCAYWLTRLHVFDAFTEESVRRWESTWVNYCQLYLCVTEIKLY